MIVSDILMPGLDGFALCREIKRDVALSDVPVILLSWKEDLLQRVRELKPDAILLDLEMPEMSGIDMLKRLMLLGKAKVIVVSSVGQTGSPQALEARRLGAVDVIAKPSGAMSLDLQAKKGHEIVQSLRRALALGPGETA